MLARFYDLEQESDNRWCWTCGFDRRLGTITPQWVAVEVYEATDAIGGIAQTVNYKNNRIDIGGHRFFTKSERVLDWWLNIIPVRAPARDGQDRELQVKYPATALIVEAGEKEKKSHRHT